MRGRHFPQACMVIGLAGLVVGCASAGRYGDLKAELEELRYQYNLERLYVAGLAAQNRQLERRRQALLDQLQDADSTAIDTSETRPDLE